VLSSLKTLVSRAEHWIWWLSRLDLSESCDVVGQVTIWLPIGHFLLMVLWNQCSISNGFRDIQWQLWHNSSRDLKWPVNKGQGLKKGNSFCHQLIPHIRLPIGFQYFCSFAPFNNNTHVTYDSQQTDWQTGATL